MSVASLASKVFEDAQAFCNCVSMDPCDAEEFANAMRRGVTVPQGAGGTPDRLELAKLLRQQEALRAELEHLKNHKLEGGPLPDELLATSVYLERQHTTSARHGGSAEPHTVACFTEKQIQERIIAKMLADEKILDKKYTNPQGGYEYVQTSTSSGVTSLIQTQRPGVKDSPRPFKSCLGGTRNNSMPPTKLPENTDKHMHTLKDCHTSICSHL